MPTECSRERFGFEAVEGRQVVAAFDGGQVTSDAGALLLGAVNRAIGLVGRLAGCFADWRCQELVEHSVETLLMQRICGLALATRTWSTTTSSATTRCWRPWSASSRHGARTARRWPARGP